MASASASAGSLASEPLVAVASSVAGIGSGSVGSRVLLGFSCAGLLLLSVGVAIGRGRWIDRFRRGMKEEAENQTPRWSYKRRGIPVPGGCCVVLCCACALVCSFSKLQVNKLLMSVYYRNKIKCIILFSRFLAYGLLGLG